MDFVRTDVTFHHYKDGDKLEFDLQNIPFDMLQPLVHAVKWEFLKRSSLACAPSFRAERAEFIDKVTKAAKEKGLTIDTKQTFIDF